VRSLPVLRLNADYLLNHETHEKHEKNAQAGQAVRWTLMRSPWCNFPP
jgi:hypothetical protein